MWNVIKSIFSSSSLIETGMKGIDKAIFTDQEKKELHLKMLPHYQAFKLAQRLLALIFVSSYIICLFLYLILLMMDSAHAYQVLDGVHQFNLHMIVITIVGFYFAGGVVDSLKRKKDE